MRHVKACPSFLLEHDPDPEGRVGAKRVPVFMLKTRRWSGMTIRRKVISF